MTDTLLPDWLARRALTHRNHPALLAAGVTWTFADLQARVDEAARRLAAASVTAGDRVALLARNGPAFVVVAHAVGRLGAVLVPLNVRLTPAELGWQLADVGAALLLHDTAHAPLAEAAAAGAGARRLVELGPDGPPGPADAAVALRERIALDAVHTVIYTSGTTGRPKGVALTYGNYWWSAAGSALHLGTHHDDRWLAMLPLFHVGGLAILIRSAMYGMPVVLHEAFDPARANRSIDEDGVTLVSVVANMLRRMLDERGDRPYPPALRCVLLGGGPAPRSLLEACVRRGFPLAPTYGLTEAASQVATLPPADLARKLGAAGLPLPTTEVRIERDGRPVPPGETGEIVVRGPTVTPAYVGRETAGSPLDAEGWFRTGDLGQLDAEGYLTVLDRRDDLIVSGGENVYPAEVEAVLLAHPGVEEAAVVGVPDERWGEVPVAFVKPRANRVPAESELLDALAGSLAPYKRPRRIIWLEAVPRNASGKLLRRELRERV